MKTAQSARERIDDEAALWVVRLSAVDVAEADRAAFQAWLGQGSYSRVAYQRQVLAWERSERLRALRPSADIPDPDLLAAARVGAAGDRRAAQPARRWVAAAVGGLAVLAAAGGWFANGSPAYATAVGARRVVVLSSSAKVELNTDSEIRVRRWDTRVQVVRGEAAFDLERTGPGLTVVARSGAPLSTPELTLRPGDGAKFNVRIRAEEVEVTVAAGSVTTLAEDGAAPGLLPGGVVARFGPAGAVLQTISPQDVERTMAWRAGRIVLAGETLKEAVVEFNRYNTHRLIVADDSIAGLRLGGYFNANDPEGFVTSLHRSFGVRVVGADGAATYLAGAN